jgi:thiol-disulfide isomerase/thioredoxin
MTAPALALMALPFAPLVGGTPVRMSDMKGRVVLLEFWKTTCGPCRIWKPVFEKLDQRYASKGLRILSIDTDETPKLAAEYLKTHPTTLKVFADPSGSAQRLLAQKAQPAMALFDGDGVLMWTAVGFGPTTEADMTWRIERYLEEIDTSMKP